MSGEDEMRLAEGFDPAGYGDWKALVEKALKGADFDKALSTETYDGFRLQPLYTPADAPETALRPASGRGVRAAAWDIRQAVVGPTAADVQAQIAEELSEGATSVLLRLDAALRQGGTVASAPDAVGVAGAALHDRESFAAALAGVDLAATPVAVDAGAAGLAAAEALSAAAKGKLPAGAGLGLDPLSAAATAGLSTDAVGAWATAAIAMDVGPDATLFTASSATFFDAGASEAEELGCLLASGVAYLRALEAAGMDVSQAAGKIAFTLALSQDQFLTIAKARAARALWAAVLKHAGAADAAGAMRLDGVTAARMFTRHDPHVNVLRATIAGFAGAVAGLDGVTVLPFDARMAGHDPLARRIARNLQVVLAEESNLGRVADPSGGAFFVENLTDELARAGWAVFQEIEQAGGMAAALDSGMLATRIGETVAARNAKAAKRREAITGVSEFANLADPAPTTVDLSAVLAAAKAASGAHLLAAPLASGDGALALAPVSAPYEALRDAADAYAARSGGRPAVFLANIGALSDFNVRATFAANAFAAGGVAVAGAGDDVFADAAAAAAGFAASGAKIACICGADAGYAASAADYAKALKAAGAAQVWMAGRGGAAEAELKAAGVDSFIYMGADILAAMQSAHRAIGV